MRGLVAGGRRFPGATNPMTFETLRLSPALLRALSENGYTTPTPIQLEAIPLALAGHDLLGGAQTGTGQNVGRAHVSTAVTHAPRVCRHLLETQTDDIHT